jgi:capsular exopolysaccharide synthesis family protein
MSSNLVAQHRAVVPAAPMHSSEPLELLLYWRTVWKRKWWILGLAAIFGALAGFAVSFMTPIYRATVTLLIEQNRARLVSIEEVYSGVSANREHYQTQTEMLKAPVLAAAVIQKLGLATHPEFDPRQRKPSYIAQFLPGESQKQTHWSQENVDVAVLADFLRRISVEPVRSSQLVKLSFDAADPQLAARVANALANAYLETDIDVRAKMTQRAGDWLADRLSGLKKNLEDSERALQQFREREGMLDTTGLAQGGATRQFEELSRTLTDAKMRRLEAESNYQQIKAANGRVEAIPLVLRSAYVDRLRALEGTADSRLATLSKRYGTEHPRMIEAQRDLKQRNENSRSGVDAVIASFAKEVEVARATERATEQSLNSVKGSIQGINRKEFQLDALQRDVTTNRQIYERFLNRYRETRAAGDTQSSVVARVVDPAIPVGSPYKPRKDRIVLIGVMLGLLLGAIGALLRERMDSTLRTSEDVEGKLGLPTLAVLPLLSGGAGKVVGRHFLEEPGSIFSEAIRTARTSLLLSSIDVPSKILLVTSSVPSEGKSAFAVNLALAHAQANRVLLVEADLRRPSIAQHLGLGDNTPGLTALYDGTATLAQCVQRVEGSSLYVLPAGRPPANPSELITSERFQHMIRRIAAACDILIIDSPPVHLVSDAVLLSTMATGVLFVVKADSTPYPLARRCLRTLQDAGAPIIGVALNQVDFTKAGRYYGGYTEYAKEYGGYYTKPVKAT